MGAGEAGQLTPTLFNGAILAEAANSLGKSPKADDTLNTKPQPLNPKPETVNPKP